MNKNITIPLALFNQIIDLLEYFDVPEHSAHFRQDYETVLHSLLKKKRRAELRNAYAKILLADNDDDRHDARILYLQQKRLTNDEPF